MVAGPDELLVLAGYLYEAAVTRSLWKTALRRICLAFSGLGMALFVLDLKRREVLFRIAYKRPPDELTGGAAVRIPPFGDVDFSALDPGSLQDHQLKRRGETVRHTFQTWPGWSRGLLLALVSSSSFVSRRLKALLRMQISSRAGVPWRPISGAPFG
jgi:hypothetical protein